MLEEPLYDLYVTWIENESLSIGCSLLAGAYLWQQQNEVVWLHRYPSPLEKP